MKKLFLTALVAMFTFIGVQAQTALVPYKWDAFGLKFKVPESSDILESSNERFVVDNPNLRVEIQSYNGPALDSDDMSTVLLSWAEDAGISYNESTEVQSFSGSGLEGVSIEGDRSGDQVAVAIMISTKSNIAVVVSVIYGTGLEQVANDIINSFSMSK